MWAEIISGWNDKNIKISQQKPNIAKKVKCVVRLWQRQLLQKCWHLMKLLLLIPDSSSWSASQPNQCWVLTLWHTSCYCIVCLPLLYTLLADLCVLIIILTTTNNNNNNNNQQIYIMPYSRNFRSAELILVIDHGSVASVRVMPFPFKHTSWCRKSEASVYCCLLVPGRATNHKNLY